MIAVSLRGVSPLSAPRAPGRRDWRRRPHTREPRGRRTTHEATRHLAPAFHGRGRGRSVLVLEARDRVGGRVLTHPLTSGGYTELGGMFTGPTQDRIQALAQSVGVGMYPTYNVGSNVFMGANGRRSTYPNDSPLGSAPIDPIVAPDILLSVLQLDQLAATVPVDAPWTAPNAADLDRQTLDAWLRDNSTGNPEFLAVVSAATEAIFGGEPHELSLLYTLFYIAASGNEQNVGTFERNFNTGGGAQEQRFVGGAEEIPLRVAAIPRPMTQPPRIVPGPTIRHVPAHSTSLLLSALLEHFYR
ncbi:MAG: FAD-dependent oxidoreductase [Candidatus Binatia bacterium]